jgi:hypothetical protein
MNWQIVDIVMDYNNYYSMVGNNFGMDDIDKIGYH